MVLLERPFVEFDKEGGCVLISDTETTDAVVIPLADIEALISALSKVTDMAAVFELVAK